MLLPLHRCSPTTLHPHPPSHSTTLLFHSMSHEELTKALKFTYATAFTLTIILVRVWTGGCL